MIVNLIGWTSGIFNTRAAAKRHLFSFVLVDMVYPQLLHLVRFDPCSNLSRLSHQIDFSFQVCVIYKFDEFYILQVIETCIR